MTFPTNPMLGEQYTNAAGSTFECVKPAPYAAWKSVSKQGIGGASYNFYQQPTAPSSPKTGEWWWDGATLYVWKGDAWEFVHAGTATIVLNPATLPNGQSGTPYASTLVASGGAGPYTFSVTGGALPPGLVLNPATGVLSGTWGSATFTGVLSPSSLTFYSGAVFSATLTCTGGTGSKTYAVTAGLLPAGITLNGSTGVLSGTPSGAAGTAYTFAVSVTDSTGAVYAGPAYTGLIQNQVISIAPSTLVDGTEGVAYSQTLSSTGGTSPYTYSLTSGALPPSVSLNSTTGAISGTPAVPSFSGTWSPSTMTTAFTASTALSGLSATVTGGTSPYSYAVSLGALPAGVSLNASTGALTGTPSGSAGTKFFFAVRATDAAGKTSTKFYSGAVQNQPAGVSWSVLNSNAASSKTILDIAASDDAQIIYLIVNSGIGDSTTHVYKSSNGGTSFSNLSVSGPSFTNVCCSDDGTKVILAGNLTAAAGNEALYYSTNSGTSFTSAGGPGTTTGWLAAMNGAGTKAFAGSRAAAANTYKSTDGGASYSLFDGAIPWQSLAMSEDGTKFIGTRNDGGTWSLCVNATGANSNFSGQSLPASMAGRALVAMSRDGTKAVVAGVASTVPKLAFAASPFTSWTTATGMPGSGTISTAPLISSDGVTIVVQMDDGKVYKSTNGGTSFTQVGTQSVSADTSLPNRRAIWGSSDLSKLISHTTLALNKSGY